MPTKGGKVDDDRVKTAVLLLLFTRVGLHPGQAFQVQDNSSCHDSGCYNSDPGPLNCFSAPRHQILAKSAPQKVRIRDKAEFATKVRK